MKTCLICGPATAPGCEQHVAPSRPPPSISALLVRWKVPLDPHLQRDALIERLRAVEEAWGIPAAVLALPEPSERPWRPWVDQGVQEGDVEPMETSFVPECYPMHAESALGCSVAVRTETAAVVDMIAQRDIQAGEAVTCRGSLVMPPDAELPPIENVHEGRAAQAEAVRRRPEAPLGEFLRDLIVAQSEPVSPEPPAPLLRGFAEDLRASPDHKVTGERIRADAAALRITVGTLRAEDERSRRTIAEQAAEIGRLQAKLAEASKPLCDDAKCSTCLRGNR